MHKVAILAGWAVLGCGAVFALAQGDQPTAAREGTQMLKAHGVEPPVLRPVLSASEVTAMQQIGARIHVEDDLNDYAVAITGFTRSHPRVALGASPRATLALVQAAKGWALLAARTYVIPDDHKAVAPAVLAHRIVLTADTEPDAKAREQVVEEALAKVSIAEGCGRSEVLSRFAFEGQRCSSTRPPRPSTSPSRAPPSSPWGSPRTPPPRSPSEGR